MFIISGRRESQIGIGPDSYENIRRVRPNERENISVIQRYTCFCLALGICGLIQHDYRLIYLYVITVMLWLFAIFRGTCTFHLSLFTMGGLGHSAVHNYWPFLNETTQGFDTRYSAFPDVLFHMTMLVFVWVSMKVFLRPIVQKFTIFAIIGSIINCALTNYTSVDSMHYVFFNSTSVFQAISTAYWIATSIHYGEWDKCSYAKSLFYVNFIILSNWGFYEYDHWGNLGLGLVGLSMKYKYIEGLFMCSTWIPLVCFKPQY